MIKIRIETEDGTEVETFTDGTEFNASGIIRNDAESIHEFIRAIVTSLESAREMDAVEGNGGFPTHEILFPDVTIPEDLPEGFEDSSSYMENCPTFYHRDLRVTLYIDHEERDRRVYATSRFTLEGTIIDPKGDVEKVDLGSTDTVDDLKKLVSILRD